MLIRVGLEPGVGGRTLAWGLDFPGCFADGANDSETLINFARRLLDYEAWVDLHAEVPWFTLVNPDFRIVEAAPSPLVSSPRPGAFFEDDRRPLSSQEMEQVLLVQRWQSEELLAGLEFLPEEATQLLQESAGLISRTLRLIAQDMYEILSVLEPALPSYPAEESPLAQFEFTSALIPSVLAAWVGRETVIEKNEERWSARKATRLLLWRLRVGIDQVRALVL